MLIVANIYGFNPEKWEPHYKFYNLYMVFHSEILIIYDTFLH